MMVLRSNWRMQDFIKLFIFIKYRDYFFPEVFTVWGIAYTSNRAIRQPVGNQLYHYQIIILLRPRLHWNQFRSQPGLTGRLGRGERGAQVAHSGHRSCLSPSHTHTPPQQDWACASKRRRFCSSGQVEDVFDHPCCRSCLVATSFGGCVAGTRVLQRVRWCVCCPLAQAVVEMSGSATKSETRERFPGWSHPVFLRTVAQFFIHALCISHVCLHEAWLQRHPSVLEAQSARGSRCWQLHGEQSSI